MNKTLRIIFILATLFFSYFQQVKAQSLNLWRDYLEVYEVQPASARASAMGFAQVANGGTIAEARINPSTLNKMPQKLQTEVSYTWPSFVDDKGRSSFIGAAYRVSPKLSVGLSRFNYSVKDPVFGLNIANNNNTIYTPGKVSETFYTATASYEVVPGLHGGINLSVYNYDISTGENSSSITADAGVVYEKKLNPKSKNIIDSRLNLAASFTNLNMAKTHWKNVPPNGVNEDITMTSHLYVGAGYFNSFDLSSFVYGKSKLVNNAARTIDLLLQLQYVKFVNMRLSSDERVPANEQAKRFGYNLGAEVLFLKLLALRFGYLYEKREGDNEPFGYSSSATFPYKKGFTFGVGLNVPVQQLTDDRVPFDVSFDYFHRNNPFKWLKENSSIEELPLTNINVRLNWHLKN